MRKLRLLATPTDRDAQQVMVDELRFIKQHHKLLKAFLAFEGEVVAPASIEELELRDLDVYDVTVAPLHSQNEFAFQTEVTQYEHVDFNNTLLGADYLNWWCAVREHYAAARDFGPTQEWVVFMVVGRTRIRLRARGSIAALRVHYMDAAAAMTARDAGVLVPHRRVVFICKAEHYDEVRAHVLSAKQRD